MSEETRNRRGNGSRVQGKVWDASDGANQTASQSKQEEGGPRKAIPREKTALICPCAQHGRKLYIKRLLEGTEKNTQTHPLFPTRKQCKIIKGNVHLQKKL